VAAPAAWQVVDSVQSVSSTTVALGIARIQQSWIALAELPRAAWASASLTPAGFY